MTSFKYQMMTSNNFADTLARSFEDKSNILATLRKVLVILIDPASAFDEVTMTPPSHSGLYCRCGDMW